MKEFQHQVYGNSVTRTLLKSKIDGFLRNNDLSSWEEMLFYSVSLDHSLRRGAQWKQ